MAIESVTPQFVRLACRALGTLALTPKIKGQLSLRMSLFRSGMEYRSKYVSEVEAVDIYVRNLSSSKFSEPGVGDG
jgi:hypothetical protein